MQPTKEQLDFYYTRTRNHVSLVEKYIEKIYNLYRTKYPTLPVRQMFHDQSKYQEPEFTPYVFLTWKYHCKDLNIPFETTKELEKEIREATYHHCKNNRHHPEFHDTTTSIDSINSKDRDKPPEKLIDATKMWDVDIAEMVADWCAMSEERGNTPQEWAKMNIGTRWKFTQDQEKLIYNLIDQVWRK